MLMIWVNESLTFDIEVGVFWARELRYQVMPSQNNIGQNTKFTQGSKTLQVEFEGDFFGNRLKSDVSKNFFPSTMNSY